MNISQEEFDKLEYINKGAFGYVFKKNNIALKRYRNNVKLRYGEYPVNPCLKFKRTRLNRLKKRAQNIEHTDLIFDYLYINGDFAGVCTVYYDGPILANTINYSFNKKKTFGKEIVRNAMELTNQKIYPLDYKCDNVMLDKDEKVKIIDLDDILTKVTIFPNRILLKRSLESLKRMLIIYFHSNQLDVPNDLLAKLTNNPRKFDYLSNKNLSYKSLEKLIDYEGIANNFLFLDSEDFIKINLKELGAFIKEQELKLVLLFNKRDLANSEIKKHVITRIKNNELPIYDAIYYRDLEKEDKIDEYINCNNTINCYGYQKKS